MVHENPSDPAISELLRSVRRIAVVGLSPKPHRDSNLVARFLIEQGYDVVAVHPREERILGRPVYRRLSDVPGGVDLADVFRRGDALGEVVDDALEAHVPALWFQFNCVNELAAQRAATAGVRVVMDRCIMVDHRRLLGS